MRYLRTSTRATVEIIDSSNGRYDTLAVVFGNTKAEARERAAALVRALELVRWPRPRLRAVLGSIHRWGASRPNSAFRTWVASITDALLHPEEYVNE